MVGAVLLTGWILVEFKLLRPLQVAETGAMHPIVIGAYLFVMTILAGLLLAAPTSLLFVTGANLLGRRFPTLFNASVWSGLGALASAPIYLLSSSDPGLQFGIVEAFILALAGAAGGYTSYRVILARRIKSDPGIHPAPHGKPAS